MKNRTKTQSRWLFEKAYAPTTRSLILPFHILPSAAAHAGKRRVAYLIAQSQFAESYLGKPFLSKWIVIWARQVLSLARRAHSATHTLFIKSSVAATLHRQSARAASTHFQLSTHLPSPSPKFSWVPIQFWSSRLSFPGFLFNFDLHD